MSHYSKEEKNAIEARKKKVQSFHLQIDKDDLAVGEEYREREHIDEEPVEAISSFSGDEVRQQHRRRRSERLKEVKKLEKKQRKYADRRNKRIYRLVWFVSAVLIGITIGLYFLVGVNDMLGMSRSKEAKTVSIEIPEKPSLETVSRILKSKGVISEPKFFEMYAKRTKKTKFSQGTYNIKTNMDYEAIINFLATDRNRTDTVTITVTEGMNIEEIAQLLVDNEVLKDSKHFKELCKSDYFDEDYPFVTDKNADKRPYKLEGYLFPDTYECYKNERAEQTITRMLDDFEARTYYNQNVEGYTKAINIAKICKEKKVSMHKILTIASLIQAEAADTEDMYYISSVIHNRLDADIDMGVNKLGLDSTKYYPYKNKKAVPEELRSTFKSEYNTYKISGLPAGPINSPGMQAIMAALNPEETDYYYFYHDKDGDAHYASSLDEHNYNMEVYG